MGMDIDQTSWAVMREMSKLAYNVDADQITRAINQLKAQALFAHDGTSGKPTLPMAQEHSSHSPML